MFKNKIKIVITLLFTVFTMGYFWYTQTYYIPIKVSESSKKFMTKESIRHLLKVPSQNLKGYIVYQKALREKNEDLVYDSLDYFESSIGFLQSFEETQAENVNSIKKNVFNIIKVVEGNRLKISQNNLMMIEKTISHINMFVEEMERNTWDKLHTGIVYEETFRLNISVIILYLVVLSALLLILLLVTLRRKSLLEEEKLLNQKLILTQSKVAAVGEMIGNIAHQWRQPLSIITTNVSMIGLNIKLGKEISQEELVSCSKSVMSQSEYLTRTIDDFRNFFKDDTTRVQEHSLDELFERLENLVKDTLQNNYIKNFNNIENNIVLKLNDNILLQAFINICNNANDAMVENVKDTNLRFFFINVEKKENYVEIIFRDSGGGIKEDVIDKIFEPYFTTKHPSIGTGIGLYMTNQIITKQLKGTIEVSNIKYQHNELTLKGAQFKISIPFI